MCYKIILKRKFNRLIGLLVFIIGLSLTGCSEDNWSKEEQSQFIQECNDENGTNSYCKCFMEKAMEKFPVVEDAWIMDFEEAIELSKDCN